MKTCEVLIVGAGPAGIAAAVSASQFGKRVTIIDDNPVEGGQVWRGRAGGPLAASWFTKLHRSGAGIVAGARVIAGDAQRRTLQVETATAAFDVSYGDLVIATGARELFLPFSGWTLPNVLGVGGLQALVKTGLPVRGKRIVVAGSGPLLLLVAAYLRKQGATVPVVAEQADLKNLLKFGARLLAHPGKLWQAVGLRSALASTSYSTGSWVESAVESAEGSAKLSGVTLRRPAGSEFIACDYLATGFGFCPNTELARYLGCLLLQGGTAVSVDAFQQTSVKEIYCAGEAAGIGGVDLALVQGEIAGLAAAGRRDLAAQLFPARTLAQRFAAALHRTFAPRAELRALPAAETIVCRCEDVRIAQLQTAGCWRSAKLHLRCGMGPCQGRICGPAVRFLFGWKPDSVRPPVFPARVASLVSESIQSENGTTT